MERKKALTDVSECNECGTPGRTWPNPLGNDLCVACFTEWFEQEERVQPRWVAECRCGDFLKGTAPQVQCGCGRTYVCFQLY